ncbi:MAG: vitamin B12 dependent-methionine synthase activation domain-containing protein, partial [Thermoanaerobaculia bacterium]
GLLALDKAFSQAGWRVPVAVSVTIETTGTMLAGQDAEALAVSLMHADLLYLGLNCATGPELMTDSLRTLSELARTRIGCVPNAGLPDEDGIYQESPEDFRRIFGRFLDHGWLNMVGGCCGTTNEHVTALAELVKEAKPRALPHHQRSFISGIEAVELTIDNRPLFVGERTNVLGSRKFKRLIAEGEIEAAAEIGRGQARAGAQAIDICMQDPDRDEVTDMERFLDQLTRMVKVPLMIDTTDAEVMEQALTWCQGKAVLNSINLEEGRTRFERVIPLARQYGAAVIVGMIDEAGMAVSVVRKLEVARRSYQILTEEMDFAPEDIWFDALVFPCGTGDENYIGSAATTIEGVRQIKSEFPLARTVLGISNVSFGLPVAGREVLNAVFLYHNTQAGLDAALVNTQRLARFADIPEAERRLAESLIFLDLGDVAASEKAVADFAEYFRDQDSRVVSTPRAELPLDERLARSVVEGSKEGLVEDLGVALEDPSWPQPLDIINGPLMVGMAEVGRLFNENQLIVAEVLQSAEVMKAAVGFLEPHMERQEGTSRGKILLATVKGDVHDIGKNLVEIILSNNGFDVVNLGIKVPSERIIQAVQEHQPDVLGLSGLLVKSAQMMVTTADDLSVVDIDIPLIVGGAALTRRFTHKKIAATYDGFCTYAKDAMHGLSLVQRITDAAKRPDLEAEVRELIARDRQAETAPTPFEAMGSTRCAAVDIDLDPPAPPHLDRIVEELDLDEVWPLLNPQMLYGKHLGLKASVKQLEAKHDPKLAHLKGVIGEIQEVARSGAMKARAVWQFFPAASDGNRLLLLDPGTGKAVVEWSFPRQRGTDGLGLPDYVLPQGDHVALFVTTAGDGVMKQVEQWKQEGEFLMSHALAALALETAEAAAELVHRKMRQAWGFADAQEMTLQDLFAGRYRGKRYSFGYPACPDLEMQRELFSTLRPEEIGVRLTEGDMMEPEASVSALVFHHPQARYFGV